MNEQEAIKLLESKGWYMDYVWHINDVKDKFECTDEQAFDVLSKVFSSEWLAEQINESIENIASEDYEYKQD